MSTRKDRDALLVVNGLGAVAAAAFAAAGMARPGYVENRTTTSPTELTTFWAASSAVRTWAITAPLIGAILVTGRPTPQLLTVAGMIQLGDSALGIWQRNPRMALAPAAMGIIHLTSAHRLSRSANPS